MKTLGVREIAIADITVADRLRSVDDVWVDALATTIAAHGQPHPILLAKAGEGWLLLDGEHRLKACDKLGQATVLATLVEASAAEQRLLQIDANLIRRDLNPLDRAAFLAERKKVYEELHPETKAGVAGALAKHGSANDIMSFAAETAEKIGLSRKSIERAVSIHFQIDEATRKRIAGTPIAEKQNELLALAKEGPQRQTRIVDMLLGGEARNVRAAVRILDGHAEPASIGADANERQLKRLMDAWARASAKARRGFIEKLAAEGYLTDASSEEAA